MPRPISLFTGQWADLPLSHSPAMAASVVQLFTGSPSTHTTQVPQLLVSQPQWVPVMPR